MFPTSFASGLTTLEGRDLLRIGDLSRRELDAILDLAGSIKTHPRAVANSFPGRTLAMYFNKPSTRTRVSFAEAAHHLGLLPLTLGPDDLQLARGETIGDTAKTLSLYGAAIVIRTFAQDDVEEVARHASVPVINALTDEHHPCQALADMLTIRDHFGRTEGVQIAFVGDFNNVARSLVDAGTMMGASVIVATPDELRPGDVPELPQGANGCLGFTGDVDDAIRGADVVYTDVWISMGDAEADHKKDLLRRYRVDTGVMANASDGAIFMHCLPAHRGDEVTAEVIDGRASAVWQQAFNRLPTEEAILFSAISSSEDRS